MINNLEEKIFFNPGDIVILKHKELKQRPAMFVVNIAKESIDDDIKKNKILGVNCRWFDLDNRLCESIFSTKDIEHYK